jgi:hypothetical protein
MVRNAACKIRMLGERPGICLLLSRKITALTLLCTGMSEGHSNSHPRAKAVPVWRVVKELTQFLFDVTPVAQADSFMNRARVRLVVETIET